jgi:hypothetical protein
MRHTGALRAAHDTICQYILPSLFNLFVQFPLLTTAAMT